MENQDEFFARVREITEYNTGRPAYLASDEEWGSAFDEAVMTVAAPKPPVCPYCGASAPYGDERIGWLFAHHDNQFHRWWWRLKNLWFYLFYPTI